MSATGSKSSASKRISESLEDDDPKKKPCIENNNNNKLVQLEGLLEGDIGDAVFSFLDKSELLRIVRVSKAMKAKLKYEHVIRSGMMHTHSKTTITRVVNAIDKIYVPSPARILQLINGKVCERCQSKKIHQVFREFGLFMCVARRPGDRFCLDQMTQHVESFDTESTTDLSCVAHHVVCRQGVKQVHILAGDPWISSIGERCGPLITAQHLQTLRLDPLAVQKLLKERQDADPRRDQVPVIRQIFQENVVIGERRQNERLLERKAKAAKALISKKKRVLEMIDSLASFIPHEKVWKAAALAYTWTEDYHSETHLHKHPLRFSISIVNNMMYEYIESPKKATPSLLQEIAEDITDLFDHVYEKEYHSLSFLNKNDYETILRTQLLQSKPLVRLLDAATETVLNGDIPLSDEDDFLLAKLFHHWDPDIGAAVVASTTVAEGKEDFAYSLARSAYQGGRNVVTNRDHRKRYNSLCRFFPQLLENACNFVETAADRGLTFVDPAANDYVSEVWLDWKMTDLLRIEHYEYRIVMERAEVLRTRHQRRMGLQA